MYFACVYTVIVPYLVDSCTTAGFGVPHGGVSIDERVDWSVCNKVTGQGTVKGLDPTTESP